MPRGSSSPPSTLRSVTAPISPGGLADVPLPRRSRLVRQAFPLVVNVPAPATTYLAAVISALDASELAGARAVLLHSRTGFSREVAGGALRAAGDVGLAVTAIPFDLGDGDGAARSVQGRGADV